MKIGNLIPHHNLHFEKIKVKYGDGVED